MTLLLDLAFISKAHKPVTDQGLEEILTKHNQEEGSIPETIGSDVAYNNIYNIHVRLYI